VSHVDEVLKHALVRQPVAIVWDEEAEEAAAAARAKDKGAAESAVTH
jgi:ATP-dependent Lon protease